MGRGKHKQIEVRKPVAITGLPDAIEYSSLLQQSEYESSMMDRCVDELPIAMLMEFVYAKHSGGIFYHCSGLYHYTPEATDERLIELKCNTVIWGAGGGCWTDNYFIQAIDWAHSLLITDVDNIVSFAGVTLRKFDEMLDDFDYYTIPGTGDSPEAHCLPDEMYDWYAFGTHMSDWTLAQSKHQLKHDIPHKERELGLELVNFAFSHSITLTGFESKYDSKPWYLLPAEYEQMCKHAEAQTAENPTDRLKKYYHVNAIGDSHLCIGKCDDVRYATYDEMMAEFNADKSNTVFIPEMFFIGIYKNMADEARKANRFARIEETVVEYSMLAGCYISTYKRVQYVAGEVPSYELHLKNMCTDDPNDEDFLATSEAVKRKVDENVYPEKCIINCFSKAIKFVDSTHKAIPVRTPADIQKEHEKFKREHTTMYSLLNTSATLNCPTLSDDDIWHSVVDEGMLKKLCEQLRGKYEHNWVEVRRGRYMLVDHVVYGDFTDLDCITETCVSQPPPKSGNGKYNQPRIYLIGHSTRVEEWYTHNYENDHWAISILPETGTIDTDDALPTVTTKDEVLQKLDTAMSRAREMCARTLQLFHESMDKFERGERPDANFDEISHIWD